MDREITLRDYGRVLWSGRWLILAATVIAAIVGLALSFATTTTYRATAEGSRYPEKHVYELIFDPGPTAKRVELSVKKKRVEPF